MLRFYAFPFCQIIADFYGNDIKLGVMESNHAKLALQKQAAK